MFLLLLRDFSVALLSTVVLEDSQIIETINKGKFTWHKILLDDIIGRFTHSSVLKFNIIQLDPP